MTGATDEFRAMVAGWPTGKQDTRVWRVGSRYGIHLYAVNPDGADESLGTFHRPEVARQVVAEHQLVTTPYAGEGHHGGSWVSVFMALVGDNTRLRTLTKEWLDLMADRVELLDDIGQHEGAGAVTALKAEFEDHLRILVGKEPC